MEMLPFRSRQHTTSFAKCVPIDTYWQSILGILRCETYNCDRSIHRTFLNRQGLAYFVPDESAPGNATYTFDPLDNGPITHEESTKALLTKCHLTAKKAM